MVLGGVAPKEPPNTFLLALAVLGDAPNPLKNPPPPPPVADPPKMELVTELDDGVPNAEVLVVVGVELDPPNKDVPEEVGVPNAGFPPKTEVDPVEAVPNADPVDAAVVTGAPNAEELPPKTDVEVVAVPNPPKVDADVTAGLEKTDDPPKTEGDEEAVVTAVLAPPKMDELEDVPTIGAVELDPKTDEEVVDGVVVLVAPKTEELAGDADPKMEGVDVVPSGGVAPKTEVVPVDLAASKTDELEVVLVVIGAEVVPVVELVVGAADPKMEGVDVVPVAGVAPNTDEVAAGLAAPKTDELVVLGEEVLPAAVGTEDVAGVGAPNADPEDIISILF